MKKLEGKVALVTGAARGIDAANRAQNTELRMEFL